MKTPLQVSEEVAELIGSLKCFDFEPAVRARLLDVLDVLRPFENPAVPIPLALVPEAIRLLEEAGRIVEDPKNLPWEEVEDLDALLKVARDEAEAWHIYFTARACSNNFTAVSLEAWCRRLEAAGQEVQA